MERLKILIMAVLLCSCANANNIESNFSFSDDGKVKVHVVRSFSLPERLKEISALVYLDHDRFACVQDEEGVIFIFNGETKKIEKEIRFAGPGDYEGLAFTGNMYYVLRSDGHLYEVSDLSKSKPAVNEYNTTLTQDQDTESLCYDRKQNRLLIAVKAADQHSMDYKGIYAFSLADKKFIDEPVYKIILKDNIFKHVKSKKSVHIFQPASIAINPVNNDIYLTDGKASRLLILDPNGNAKTLIDLGDEFAQPEGIAFDQKGNMFISNEGQKKTTGNILEVEIK